MNLKTQRLYLNEITWNDLRCVHELHSMPEVDKFNTLGIPENQEVTRKVMEPDIKDQKKKLRSRFCWKIMLKKTGEFIGLAGFFLSNDRFKMGEFYYKLIPEFWGQGFATELAKEIIRFGFEDCKLHRIEAGVATENKASIRVLKKAGMTSEGIRRAILPIRGDWKDNFQFSIIEDEFAAPI